MNKISKEDDIIWPIYSLPSFYGSCTDPSVSVLEEWRSIAQLPQLLFGKLISFPTLILLFLLLIFPSQQQEIQSHYKDRREAKDDVDSISHGEMRCLIGWEDVGRDDGRSCSCRNLNGEGCSSFRLEGQVLR